MWDIPPLKWPAYPKGPGDDMTIMMVVRVVWCDREDITRKFLFLIIQIGFFFLEIRHFDFRSNIALCRTFVTIYMPHINETTK